MRINHGATERFHLLFDHTDFITEGSTSLKGWIVHAGEEARPHCRSQTFGLPKKLLCTFLWTAEDNGKKIHPSSKDDSDQTIPRLFSKLGFWWQQRCRFLFSCNGIINCWCWGKKQPRKSDDHQRGKGTKKKLSFSFVVCFVLSKQMDLTICKPWLESWILMLLRLRRGPPWGSGCFFFFFRKTNKDKEHYDGHAVPCVNWRGSSTNTPDTVRSLSQPSPLTANH